jgi:peptide-methionine (S)-S-oxide reductase
MTARTVAVLCALPVAMAAVACRTASAPIASDPAPSASTTMTGASAPSEFAVQKTNVGTNPGHAGNGTPLVAAQGHALAAFAEGCFWGSENTFRHVDGVVATAVGFSGGHTKSPSYEDVCSHTTGHAETVLVEYDPARVTYAKLLRAFWDTHDPTTMNRQGPDVGDQYRSEIFTFSPDQDRDARASLADEQKSYDRTIATRIEPMGPFYIAEDYHQQYDEKSGRESCPLPRRHGS